MEPGETDYNRSNQNCYSAGRIFHKMKSYQLWWKDFPRYNRSTAATLKIIPSMVSQIISCA